MFSYLNQLLSSILVNINKIQNIDTRFYITATDIKHSWYGCIWKLLLSTICDENFSFWQFNGGQKLQQNHWSARILRHTIFIVLAYFSRSSRCSWTSATQETQVYCHLWVAFTTMGLGIVTPVTSLREKHRNNYLTPNISEFGQVWTICDEARLSQCNFSFVHLSFAMARNFLSTSICARLYPRVYRLSW